VGKTSVNKVYDPACGSGSLLLKFRKVLGKDGVRQGYFGQEIIHGGVDPGGGDLAHGADQVVAAQLT
jgi:type I restriction-modification system DNA methylase subunit